jgi:hypothetical protein
MLCFGLQLGNIWHLSPPQIQPEIDDISSHDTLSVAAEPFHVLHMDPMGDVSMCSQLLVAQHLCHHICHALFWTVAGKHLAPVTSNPTQN